MKIFLCAKCGARLEVSYKALPKLGKIVRLVEYHECGEIKSMEEPR